MAENKETRASEWRLSRGQWLALTTGVGILAAATLIWVFSLACDESDSFFCRVVAHNPPWFLLTILSAVPLVLTALAFRGRDQRQARERQTRDSETARAGMYADRFFRAMDLLRSNSTEGRLGGIYSLEGVSHDSEKDHWTVVETLAAFVRSRARWWPEEQDHADSDEPDQRPSEEIQAVMTVLCRRDWTAGERQRVNLANSDLRGLDLRHARFANAVFEEANLKQVDLTGSDLSGANFMESNLQSAFLVEANLRRAVLIKAEMTNAILVDAKLSRADLEMARLKDAVLAKADLVHARLARADLSGANLIGAKLNHADLTRADLALTDLSGANLNEADLELANLANANLTRASLRDAVLWKANLKGAKLDDADLTGAVYHPKTVFPKGFDPQAQGMVPEEDYEGEAMHRTQVVPVAKLNQEPDP